MSKEKNLSAESKFTLSLKEILRAAYHNEESNSIAKKIVAEYKESYLANLKQKISEAIGCLQ